MTRTQLSKLQAIVSQGNLVEQILETAKVSEAKLAGSLKRPTGCTGEGFIPQSVNFPARSNKKNKTELKQQRLSPRKAMTHGHTTTHTRPAECMRAQHVVQFDFDISGKS